MITIEQFDKRAKNLCLYCVRNYRKLTGYDGNDRFAAGIRYFKPVSHHLQGEYWGGVVSELPNDIGFVPEILFYKDGSLAARKEDKDKIVRFVNSPERIHFDQAANWLMFGKLLV